MPKQKSFSRHSLPTTHCLNGKNILRWLTIKTSNVKLVWSHGVQNNYLEMFKVVNDVMKYCTNNVTLIYPYAIYFVV